MATITAAAVNDLRKRTDQPMMDCKSALTEADGDMEKAIEILRSRNTKMQAKRAGNETAEGRVGVYIDPAAKVAAIVDLRCESAPSAKADQFVALVNDLAKHVAVNKPASVEDLLAQKFNDKMTVTDRVNEVIGLIRENMKPARFAAFSGNVYGEYIHHDGMLGVLIEVEGKEAKPELLRDICAHIAAMNPLFQKVEDVPAETVAKEKAFAKSVVDADPKNVGKPANIIEKITDGKYKTWLGENVMLEQPIANAAKYDKKTCGQLLTAAGLKLVKYTRFKVGEVA